VGTISRAYHKMQEALLWSQLPVSAGELCVEIGCAPGGSAQALLDRGLRVIGIDPAAVDERLRAHPHFVHVQKRASDVKRRDFARARWLVADSNVAPQTTLDVVEAIVTHRDVHLRGLLLTLKLLDWTFVEQIPEYLDRIRSWGYRDVRARQLAANRREFCVAATRSRQQRRRLVRMTGRRAV
jgi:23S rRNA (cytidine2498-2'-O)-methyltransferase